MLTKEQEKRFRSHLLYGESDKLTTEVAFSIIAAHAWKLKTTKGRLRKVREIADYLLTQVWIAERQKK